MSSFHSVELSILLSRNVPQHAFDILASHEGVSPPSASSRPLRDSLDGDPLELTVTD